MKKEIREKAAQTRKANRDRYKSQAIQVDKDWQIVRADDLNWEIRYKNKFWGFFGSILDAFRALPAKMLGETVNNSIAGLESSQKAIHETIEKTLSLKLAKHLDCEGVQPGERKGKIGLLR